MPKLNDEITAYRTCFSTDAGKRVLANILLAGGYFDTDLATEGDIAVQNFVKRIVKRLGIGDTPRKADEYVNNLFNLKVG